MSIILLKNNSINGAGGGMSLPRRCSHSSHLFIGKRRRARAIIKFQLIKRHLSAGEEAHKQFQCGQGGLEMRACFVDTHSRHLEPMVVVVRINKRWDNLFNILLLFAYLEKTFVIFLCSFRKSTKREWHSFSKEFARVPFRR